MLFLGTEKFPEENEYAKYLTEHGGCCNAYTTTDHTLYYFDVLPEHLPGALDRSVYCYVFTLKTCCLFRFSHKKTLINFRFAQFFLCPLFTESATSREVQAVNSEHEKNIASDAWRINQFEKSLSKDNHPYKKFGTGNTQTLQDEPLSNGLDIRKLLLDFHNSWYSANNMRLVVSSSIIE